MRVLQWEYMGIYAYCATFICARDVGALMADGNFKRKML
ncbi:Hypothetical protein ETEE_1743 [Edwardsiella anguillarum ET080813]|uniref:Uncharacterized protein n=1 Tax=Edwardsiella anguillarum ET080813 TaxID=667120 RepID=A0A076LJQ1_9GAMM|nr:Hypothetical protein ETEE_1743 [Edwardsiella anguillarum ET080813]